MKFTTFKATVVERTAVPLDPLMVSVELAAGVLPEVVIVRTVVPEPVIVAGLNVAVAPAGNPVTVGVTVPLNPLIAVLLTVYVVLAPITTCWVAGVAATVKSTTLKVTGAVCTTAPLVPWMVSVELTVGVVPEVVTVRVDVPVLPTMVEGLKVAVAPVGSPVTVRAMFPVSPFNPVLLTPYVVLPPTPTPSPADTAHNT